MGTKRRRGNGEGSYDTEIKKDGSRVYIFRVMLKGKTYKKRFTRTSDGRRWIREINMAGETGQLADPNNVTFKEYAAHWEDHKSLEIKPNILNDYKRIVDVHLLPAFGKRKIKSITVTDVNHFFDKTLRDKKGVKTGRPLSPRTRRNIRNVLNGIFTYARQERVIGFNPLEDVSPIRGGIENERHALTADEVKALLNGAKAYYEKKKDYKNHSANVMVYPCILLAVFTGARLGELLALEWKDLDAATNTVTISKTYTKEGDVQEPKTKNAYRTITVPAAVMQVIQSFRDDTSPFVFHTRTGTRISERNMGRGLQAVTKFAGLEKHTFHELRHTYATLALASGKVTLIDVSHALGHAKASTTADFYLHPTGESSKKAGKAVADAIGFTGWT